MPEAFAVLLADPGQLRSPLLTESLAKLERIPFADAARRAGYSPRTARAQGHRLLKDSRVRARVRALQTALADRIDPGLILGRLENLYRRAEQDGGYRSAARILMLMGRLVGLDYRGAALKLLTPGRAPETGACLPSAVETLRAEMAGCNTRR